MIMDRHYPEDGYLPWSSIVIGVLMDFLLGIEAVNRKYITVYCLYKTASH